MRLGLWLIVLFVLCGCSSVGPVYDFYAHKHVVPMFGADYMDVPLDGPQQHEVFDSEYEPVVTEAMQLLENHRRSIIAPGISAAVAMDGELVWAGSSGWADLQNNRPLTTATQFRIGSTSKALTATLMARLVDAGKLSLNTPLQQFDIGRLNQDWATITPRQLASHTAGIPHYSDNKDWSGVYESMALQSHYEDVANAVSVFDESPVLFAPGDDFSYSSLGTVLLSAVLQESAQQSFQQAIENDVFVPLGLTQTQPEPIDESSKANSSIATFYWHPSYSESLVAEWRKVDLSHRLAGGGFISTPSDLVKLGVGMLNPAFINQDVTKALWTPQVLNNGETNEQNYALGWRVRESDFGDNIGTLFQANHGGVSRGAQSWLMVIPQYKMAVAVNINAKTDEFWEFAKVSYELVKLFLKQRNPHKPQAETPVWSLQSMH